MTNAYYLRQSLDRDLTKVSIAYQREGLHKLCAAKGWDAPVEYLDRNVSATTGRRPAYEDLCRDIADGVVKRVAVWDMDRLHRQPRELEDFIDLAERHGVELANVGGDVDLSTPSGRMFARMKGTVAKYEVEQKSVRQKAANAERAKNGKPWVQRSFGYDGNAIVPKEAAAIRKACRALLNGATLWSIAKEWNAKGLKTSKGYEWEGSKVRQTLLRPSIAGLAIHDGAIIDDAKPQWKAIVDRDTWESVRKYLADPKRFTGRSMGRKHLLSGIAYCGECGRRMGTMSKPTKSGAKRLAYQCKNMGCMKIVRDLARTDELVVGIITERLADPEAARKLSKPTVDTKALHERIDTQRKLITATREEYNEGLIDARDRNARIERILEKLSPLEDKLLGSHMSRDVKDLAGKPDAADRFEALPLDRRRGVIDTLTTVTVHRQPKAGGRFDPEAITVDWK
jgi:DNA invertase Pin-like site-specific DNA recombinase